MQFLRGLTPKILLFDFIFMFLVVGLGNPGLKYRKTRHNIGFMVLDCLQKQNNFPKFKFDKKNRAEISKGIINHKEVALVKPQTLMNNSGLSISSLIGNWKLEIGNLIVVQDDFDLPFGQMQIKNGGSSAGHHGVQSIIEHLKTRDFTRLRVGIKPITEGLSSEADSDKLKAENFVLKKFSKNEEKFLPEIISKAQKEVLSLI